MRVTERYPHESWRGSKPTWRTRSVKYTGPLGPVVVRTITNGAPVKSGNVTKVVSHVARDRARFNRFTTTPDWAGIAGAQQGAALALGRGA